MELISAITAGVFYSLSGLLTRHVLQGKKDAWAFSFYFSFIGFLVSLPFVLSSPKFPTDPKLWVYLLVVGLLITAQNYLNFRSANYISASVSGVIVKFRLVWVFILGLILIQESFSTLKLAGVVLTVLGGLTLAASKNNEFNRRGITLAFSSTILYAVVIILYKPMLTGFNSASLTASIFLLPAIINLGLMPDAVNRVKNLWKQYRYPMLIACLLGALANLAMNYSLSLGSATTTLVTIEACLILTLLLETLVLKNRTQLPRKVIAVLLAIIGAILIRLVA